MKCLVQFFFTTTSLQRYLSDAEGQRLGSMAGEKGDGVFDEVNNFEGDNGGEEDIDREMLMSQV